MMKKLTSLLGACALSSACSMDLRKGVVNDVELTRVFGPVVYEDCDCNTARGPQMEEVHSPLQFLEINADFIQGQLASAEIKISPTSLTTTAVF